MASIIALAAHAHAHAQSTSDEEAHRRFEAGQLAFADGRYETALGDFRSAYELSHRAELLYNIGQCADRLRRDREALEAFDGYLSEAAGDARFRREVEARVAVLRAAVEASAAAPPPPESELELPEETAQQEGAPEVDLGPASAPAEAPVAAIAVASVGGAVLAAGVVLLVLGELDRATVEHPAAGSTWAAISDAASTGPVLEGAGVAALAVGAVALVGGIVWATTSSGERRTEVRASLSGLSIAGTF
jgi:tetratricopeptide (TPR) repeat protein